MPFGPVSDALSFPASARFVLDSWPLGGSCLIGFDLESLAERPDTGFH
jgi:hypothetical protein